MSFNHIFFRRSEINSTLLFSSNNKAYALIDKCVYYKKPPKHGFKLYSECSNKLFSSKYIVHFVIDTENLSDEQLFNKHINATEKAYVLIERRRFLSGTVCKINIWVCNESAANLSDWLPRLNLDATRLTQFSQNVNAIRIDQYNVYNIPIADIREPYMWPDHDNLSIGYISNQIIYKKDGHKLQRVYRGITLHEYAYHGFFKPDLMEVFKYIGDKFDVSKPFYVTTDTSSNDINQIVMEPYHIGVTTVYQEVDEKPIEVIVI